MSLKSVVLTILFIAIAYSLQAQTLKGRVLDADSGQGLEGASVAILDSSFGTITDQGGYYRLDEVPTGTYQLEFRFLGYTTIVVAEIEVNTGSDTEVNISLNKNVNELDAAVVRAPKLNPTAAKTIAPVDIISVSATERFPATFFDPARMANFMPGVAQVNDQANGSSLRGASPNMNSWRLNGLDIVNPNHLTNAGTFSDRPTAYGGGTNALSAQVMDFTYFYRGNHPIRFGNSTAGIYDIALRRGNNEHNEYALQAGLIGFDATIEGPFVPDGKASYLFNSRYSFTGLLADLGVDFGGEEIAFSDVNMQMSFPIGDKGYLDLFGLIGASENDFNLPEDSTEWEDQKALFESINYENNLAIFGSKLELNLSNSSRLVWLAGFSSAEAKRRAQGIPTSPRTEESYRQEQKLSSNLLLEKNLGTGGDLSLGFEATYIDLTNEIFRDIAPSLNSQVNYDGLLLQPYIGWYNWLGDIRYKLGLHFSHWTAAEDSSVEPRLFLEWPNNNNNWSLAYGLYSQRSPYEPFNNEQAIPELWRAHHANLGWQRSINNYTTLQVRAFFQHHFNLPVNADQADDFNAFNQLEENTQSISIKSTGVAQTSGIELSLERFAGQNWFYLVNTSFFQSRYQGSDQIWRNSRFDIGYTANLAIGREWKKNKTDGRSRHFGFNLGVHASGGPRVRPIDPIASEEGQETVFINGRGFDQQLGNYFRTDLRLYLRYNRAKRNTILSLDIQNLSGLENDAYIYYDRFLADVTTQTQLGIIPVLNYRMESGK